MSKDQKVVLIPQKEGVQEQIHSDSLPEPHICIITLVRLIARHAAEQDFRAEASRDSRASDDGREQ